MPGDSIFFFVYDICCRILSRSRVASLRTNRTWTQANLGEARSMESTSCWTRSRAAGPYFGLDIRRPCFRVKAKKRVSFVARVTVSQLMLRLSLRRRGAGFRQVVECGFEVFRILCVAHR